MNIRSLRYFIAVAEEGSITRAASRVHIEQAPLTLSMKRLQSELGVALYVRSGRGIRLTDAGTLFLAYAKEAVQSVDMGVSMLALTKHGMAGRLRIGYVSSASYGLMPPMIRKFRECYPAVVCDLRQSSSNDQIRLIQDGELDFGFSRSPDPAGTLSSLLLGREPFLCAIPAGHRLARSESIRVQDLRNEPMVFLPPRLGTATFEQLIGMFSEAGIAPHVIQEVSLLEASIALVGTGIGLALVPASLRCIQVPGVVFRAIKDTQVLAEYYLLWDAKNTNALNEKFLAELTTPEKAD